MGSATRAPFDVIMPLGHAGAVTEQWELSGSRKVQEPHILVSL